MIVKNWLLDYPDMGMIDLGTNIGTFSLAIAAMGRQVLSVEPNMDNVRRFHKAVNLGRLESRITLLVNALSNERGTSRIVHHKNNQGDTRMQSVKINPQIDYSGDNYTDFITMNDLLPFCNFKAAVVKIDIQGFEFRAFANADDLFGNIHIPHVFMEWSMIKQFNPLSRSHKDSELFFKMMNFFDRRGYLPRDPAQRQILSPKDWKSWPVDIMWEKQ
jgi:FkbM family methyltransferase